MKKYTIITAAIVLSIIMSSMLMLNAKKVKSLPWLTVDGEKIVQEKNGKTVILHGINFHHFYWEQENEKDLGWDIYTEPGDYAMVAKWGCNLIRLGFGADFFYPEHGNKPDEAWAYYDKFIQKCTEKGIYVILDMHQAPGSQDIDPLNNEFWFKEDMQNRLVELWRNMAQRYADNPTVLGYDIYNEAVAPEDEMYWNLIDRIIEGIRTVDTKHILIIEPNDFGELRKIADEKVMYSFHCYEPFIVTHAGADWMADVPMMSEGYAYPGLVPVEIADIESSWENGQYISQNYSDWKKISFEVVAPEKAQLLLIDFEAQNGTVDASFRDITVLKNGRDVSLAHYKLENHSFSDETKPRCWEFEAEEGGFIGTWKTGELSISGTGSSASWVSSGWWFFDDYVKVKAGDRITVNCEIKTKLSDNAQVGIIPVFLYKKIEEFNRDRLAQEFEGYLHWADENNVPLYMGEYGCSGFSSSSRGRYITDIISICNEHSMPSTLWCFREDDDDPAKLTSFGLVEGVNYSREHESIDKESVKALKKACKGNTKF